MAEVRQRLAEGLSIPAYDGRNAATLLRTAAEELDAHGHPSEARDSRRQGIAWLESHSADERALEINRFALAQLLYLDDRLPEARALFLALAAEHPGNISYQGYLGVLAVRAGDTTEAGRILQWLAAVRRPYLSGLPSFWQARIAARLGRVDEALDDMDEALARGGQIDLWFHTDVDLASLRDNPRFRALLAPKD
jgi:predicted Zn-dependent protease